MTAREHRWATNSSWPAYAGSEQPSELIDLKARLTHLLGGKETYYSWASRLPDRLVLNNREYMAAIQAKIDELSASILADNSLVVEKSA